jgi:hypothetical protein
LESTQQPYISGTKRTIAMSFQIWISKYMNSNFGSGFKYFEILFCNDAAIVFLVPEICGSWVLSKKNRSEEFPGYLSIKVEIHFG